MVSLGRWGAAVRRDPADNLKFRRFVRDKALHDRGLQRHLRECCADDILFHINTFAFTYNPRHVRKEWPFCTFPFQDDAIATILGCIENQKDLVILKSREMGPAGSA
jgi:phage terminase large subunit-like protein